MCALASYLLATLHETQYSKHNMCCLFEALHLFKPSMDALSWHCMLQVTLAFWVELESLCLLVFCFSGSLPIPT